MFDRAAMLLLCLQAQGKGAAMAALCGLQKQLYV